MFCLFRLYCILSLVWSYYGGKYRYWLKTDGQYYITQMGWMDKPLDQDTGYVRELLRAYHQYSSLGKCILMFLKKDDYRMCSEIFTWLVRYSTVRHASNHSLCL